MDELSPVILFGGTNRERLVSVASAQTLASILVEARCWFWRADGTVQETARADLLAHERPFEEELRPAGSARWRSIDEALEGPEASRVVFVLALHGGEGEDGTLARRLEERRLFFTGSGSDASRRAFDKSEAKRIVSARGVHVASGVTVEPRRVEAARETLSAWLAGGRRIVLKPVREGSSYGLSIVATEAELEKALASIAEDPVTFLAEPVVEGTEITVGVIDRGGKLVALPTVEIRAERGRVFDYAGKYLGAGIREICPAEIPIEAEETARAAALEAHKALRCFGYSRTDFILDEEGPCFLETNTLPGLTRTSLLPQELAAAGITMQEFLEEQIALARARYG